MDVFNDKLKALDEKFNRNKNDSKISPSNYSNYENKAKKKAKKGDKMFKISTELSDVVQAKKNEVMTYDTIWSRLWKYIETHKIRDPKDKRIIIPDDKLKPIFGKAKISCGSMSRFINSHILEML